MLMSMVIIVALLAGSCLLALASDAFADALSRNVEAAFDHFEYRAALRRSRKRETESRGDVATYVSSVQRAT